MNIEQFLKAAQRASVLSIVDLDEAVSFWGEQTGGEDTSDGDDIDALLAELDTEGYIVYTDRDELDEFLDTFDLEFTISQD